MIVERLELVDYPQLRRRRRSDLTGGTTVVVGDNGQGKTNLAEALAYLATLSSFRGAPPEALVRTGRRRRRSCAPRCATTTGGRR